MAAPILSARSNSNATDSVTTAEATGSVSWTTGDLVVVLGVTEDNATTTLNTPSTTGSGLSFAAISGFPTNTASNTKVYGWSATASATSSGTITAAAGEVQAKSRLIAVWVYSAHGGIGNAATQVGDTTSPCTVSLTRAGNNSAVVLIAGDWAAVSDSAVDPTPLTGATERISDNAGLTASYNAYVIDWSDEGTAGTTAYGITNITGSPKMTLGAVEIKGSVAGGTVGGPCFDGRTFRGLTFGRVLSAPLSRETRMMAEADRLWRRDRELRRAA